MGDGARRGFRRACPGRDARRQPGRAAGRVSPERRHAATDQPSGRLYAPLERPQGCRGRDRHRLATFRRLPAEPPRRAPPAHWPRRQVGLSRSRSTGGWSGAWCETASGSRLMGRPESSGSRSATCSLTARCGPASVSGPIEIGAGAWGGAQPGAARLDVGPQAQLPAAGRPRHICARRRTGASASPAMPRRARGPRSRFPPVSSARAAFRPRDLGASVPRQWTSTCPSPACR